ncbi:hypothetical protein QTP70_009375 [Hemibagrus guttatus]|uniref:Uncharacterized protein n=1 Tax=Hemibagrus guttatus TaxID=175788 RepID=A0AAE0Q9W4_9TELE|nr:hypothetical protein QTP70_009375 [Hemibagrus guttatus]
MQSMLYTTASARISACLVDISFRMTAHQLKLNLSKTELLIIPGPLELLDCSHHLSGYKPQIPVFNLAEVSRLLL